jgi:UDP-N-acetylmuramoylalanine--D-glutamate ligase
MIFSLPEFDNKDVIFIGQDREWKSFESFIPTHAQIRSLKSIFITDENEAFYDEQLRALNPATTVIVKTAGYPGSKVPVAYTTPTKIFFTCARQLGAKIVGVTGTKGKSTTASLIYNMLKQGGEPAILGGNIGVPMLDMLADATERSIFVVELSSYQLAELDDSPDVAVITNLFRDHIDYHGSLEAYWEAKRNIMRFMTSDDTVIFNPDTEVVFHWLAELEVKNIQIDKNENVDMSKSQLIGEHNKFNYLMAKAAAQVFGVDLFSCQHILKTFKPITHRLERVRTVHGITFIDDAIASQPEAAVAGITACVHEIGPVGCVMLGGQDRGYDFTELVKLLSTLMIPKLVLFPDTGAKIKAMLPESYQPEILETRDMHEAVLWANEHCPSGSICLLSTASPSYSVWKDFEEKGDLFQKSVLGLSEYN